MDDKLELLLSGQQYKKLQEIYLHSVLEKYDLNMVDIRVLLFLSDHEKYDTARDIVEMRFMAKSYVSKAVEKLIARGLLGRKHSGTDRRYVHLSLSEEAEPIVQAAKKRRRELACSLFSGITPEQEQVLKNVAAMINENAMRILGEGRLM